MPPVVIGRWPTGAKGGPLGYGPPKILFGRVTMQLAQCVRILLGRIAGIA